MDQFVEMLAALAPPGVTYEPTRMPVWLVDRLAWMARWADKNLTGSRRALFDDFIERERWAGMRGLTLKRRKGTPNPWNMNTPDDVASAVYYYEVPLQPDDEYQWERIYDGMQFDSRLNQELAQSLIDKAAQLPSATPDRVQRLRNFYTARFRTTAIVSR